MRWKVLFISMLIVCVCIPALPASVAAQSTAEGGPAVVEQAEPEHIEQALPSESLYHWVVGSAFKPRDDQTNVEYGTLGCIYLSAAAPAEDGLLNVHVSLPAGAVIKGVRFYYRDTDSSSSRLLLTSFDGQGNSYNISVVDSTGSSGFRSVYSAATTPYTVTNQSAALALVWFPQTTGITQQLCGARIYYTIPQPVAESTKYWSAAGSTFQPRESAMTLQYAERGCIAASLGGAVTLDVDLPQNSTITNVTLFYNDTSTDHNPVLFLTTYNGLDTVTDLLVFNPDNSSGYGVLTQPLSMPHTVDPFAEALVVTVSLPSGLQVAFCGVRIEYQTGIALAPEGLALPGRRYRMRSMPGSAFQPRQSDQQWRYAGNGCMYNTDINAVYVADLQLPNRARIERLDFYYRDIVADTNAGLSLTGFTENNASQSIADAASVDNIQLVAEPLDPFFTVNTYSGGLLLDWRPFHDTGAMQLCRASVLYSIELDLVYLPLVRR